MNKQLLLVVCFAASCSFKSEAQYIGRYNVDVRKKAETLVDTELTYKYRLDKSRTIVRAYDSNNKLVWKTKPIEDAKIAPYRNKKRRIVYFGFSNFHEYKGEIGICYNNSQFGYIERRTGKFHFRGQD